MHIPALGGGMTTSSRMLSPCWTTCVSAHRTAVLEISLAAARTATTTTAPAPGPFSAALSGCRPEAAAAALFLISERQELLPAGSNHLPVRKRETKQSTPDAEAETERGNGAAQPRTHRSSLATFNARGRRRSEGTTQQPPLGAARVRGEKKNKQEAINRGEKGGEPGGPRPDGWGCSRRQAAQGRRRTPRRGRRCSRATATRAGMVGGHTPDLSDPTVVLVLPPPYPSRVLLLPPAKRLDCSEICGFCCDSAEIGLANGQR